MNALHFSIVNNYPETPPFQNPVSAPAPWGGGGDSCIEMPGCLGWGSENEPILKDALGKIHTHIEGFFCILHTNIMA